jgi:hypothetical protein
MTGEDLRIIRRRCGMSCAQFGRALGLGSNGGADKTVERKVRELEAMGDISGTSVVVKAGRLKALADRRRRAGL